MHGRALEILFVLVIAGAVLVGGPAVLASLAHLRLAASIGLIVIGLALVYAMRRGLAQGGPSARLRVSRDVAFIVATLVALIFVSAPERWALGACVAAAEFGLILELLAMLAPSPAAPDTE